MKRTVSTICLLTACLAAAGAWGQSPKVLLAKIPQSAYDLKRDPAVKLSAANGAGATNSTVLQTAIDKLNASGGIRNPVYLPSGIFQHNGFTIGFQNGSTTAACSGGQIITGGGLSATLNENATGSSLGNTTRLVYTGPTSGSSAAISYVGFGYQLGAIENHGIRIVSSAERTARDTFFTKCPIGFKVYPLSTGGVPNGKLRCDQMALMGFNKGIAVVTGAGGAAGNCDNLSWGELDFDACDVGYYINNPQSVTHLIGKVSSGSFVDTLFEINEGGDLHVGHVQLNGGGTDADGDGVRDANEGTTVLKMTGVYRKTAGPIEIRNVRIDNNGDYPVLLDLTGITSRQMPVQVIITGSIADANYNVADLVKGAEPTDKIYIRFAGPDAVVADFNSQSTVDEPPF